MKSRRLRTRIATILKPEHRMISCTAHRQLLRCDRNSHRRSVRGLVSQVTPVQTALRNCTGDDEGPSGSAIRSLIPSHRELLRSKAGVVSVAEKSGTMIPAGMVERGERSEPLQKRRKRNRRCQNRGVTPPPGLARGMP